MNKKKIIIGITVVVVAALGIIGLILAKNHQDNQGTNVPTEPDQSLIQPTVPAKNSNSNGDYDTSTNQTRIKVTVNGTELYAVLDDNATTRDFLAKLPITLPMQDLYDREMCYHFSEAFATDNLQSDNYEVGDIIYWPPRHSLVILYEQNGERFERQTLGHFESSVDIFKTTGDVKVKFELAE